MSSSSETELEDVPPTHDMESEMNAFLQTQEKERRMFIQRQYKQEKKRLAEEEEWHNASCCKQCWLSTVCCVCTTCQAMDDFCKWMKPCCECMQVISDCTRGCGL